MSMSLVPQGADPEIEVFRNAATILVVDDDASLRNLIRRILTRAGFEVVDSGSGRDAVSYCERHDTRVDLVLTDVVMPEMSGREVADGIAAASPATKVLYMSGYTGDMLAKQGILEPGTNVLNKPFQRPELVERVTQVLAGDTSP